MKKTGIFATLALIIAFSSCKISNDLQVEKRHYGKGYYVHVRNNHTDVALTENKISAPVLTENSSTENNIETTNGFEQSNSSTLDQTSTSIVEQRTTACSSKHHSIIERNENKKISSSENKGHRFISPKKKSSSEPAGDVNQIVLVILALLISPLAIFLKEGVTTRFWIDLICWLFGVGIVGFYFYGGGLLLFAIVFALLIVFDVI